MRSEQLASSVEVIILTGGASRRFGEDKSNAVVNHHTLLERVAGAYEGHRLVIVGEPAEVDAIYVQEEPRFSGPLAAIERGLREIKSDLVVIQAVDMPLAHHVMPLLFSNLIHDAALAMDAEGFLQPLAGLYWTDILRSVLRDFDTLENMPVKKLLEKLELDVVNEADIQVFLSDIDTPSDLERMKDIITKYDAQ